MRTFSDAEEEPEETSAEESSAFLTLELEVDFAEECASSEEDAARMLELDASEVGTVGEEHAKRKTARAKRTV